MHQTARARAGCGFLSVAVLAFCLALSGCGKREAKGPAIPAIPFQLVEQDGATALQFTNWTIVFEAIPARNAGIGATGLIAVAGATPEGGEYKFRGMHLRQFGGKDVNIVSVNNFTFKLVSKGRQIVFNDHAYELKDKPKQILVTREGRTQETGERK